MDFIVDFLVNNYMWFLVITIILIFALIGYVVDSREEKEVSIFDSPQELEKNLARLAESAQNKTIGDAMSKMEGPSFEFNSTPRNNTIVENVANSSFSSVSNNGMFQQNPNLQQGSNYQTTDNNATSFEVLGK